MMADVVMSFGPSLKALKKSEWLEEAAEALVGIGGITPLGARHWALWAEGSSTLLVTFESLQSIQTLSPHAHPLGWEMAKAHGWSHLGIVCDGDTWFRDQNIYSYFDDHVDDGFFDRFDHVVFVGAGPCGYAAASFSVVAPGARVLMIQPQATLDPRVTEWDKRFPEMRKTSFTDRYGYAPDMLEAASRAYVIYDPMQTDDAMHAALFTRPNVLKLRLPNMGGALQADLLQMDMTYPLVEAAARGRLTATRFARLARARRDHLPYLRRLLAKLEANGREELIRLLCQNVNRRTRAPRFERRLKSLIEETS